VSRHTEKKTLSKRSPDPRKLDQEIFCLGPARDRVWARIPTSLSLILVNRYYYLRLEFLHQSGWQCDCDNALSRKRRYLTRCNGYRDKPAQIQKMKGLFDCSINAIMILKGFLTLTDNTAIINMERFVLRTKHLDS
jgi:hypothetical protein